MKRMLALVLCAALLLCGCGAKNAMGFSQIVKFEDMKYVRPDLDAIEEAAREAIDVGTESRLTNQILDAVWDYYDVYEGYMTAYDLAYVHYQANLSDIYWEGEYEFCAENAARMDQ